MAVKRENMITVKSSDIKLVTGKVVKKAKKKKSLSIKNSDKKKAIKKADKLLKNKGLTEKQKVFCREYVIDWNGSRAYKIAYPNVNDATARANASALLTKTNIQAYCELIQNDLEKLCGISKARILNEHLKLAFSSIAHLHNTWITRKQFDELTDEQKACIKSIESSVEEKNIGGKTAANQKFIEAETVKITLFDKQKALDSISKMQGYDAPSKVELTGKNGNPLGILLTKEETKKISEQLEHDC